MIRYLYCEVGEKVAENFVYVYRAGILGYYKKNFMILRFLVYVFKTYSQLSATKSLQEVNIVQSLDLVLCRIAYIELLPKRERY